MANLRTRNAMWPVTKGVSSPVTNEMILVTMMVGRRPNASENQPKNSIPGMAPKKKTVWERAGIHAWSHTQSNSTVIEV